MFLEGLRPGEIIPVEFHTVSGQQCVLKNEQMNEGSCARWLVLPLAVTQTLAGNVAQGSALGQGGSFQVPAVASSLSKSTKQPESITATK